MIIDEISTRVNNETAGKTCCTKCHFTWEEEHCLEYLSEEEKTWLLSEHKRIRDLEYPVYEVYNHIQEENKIFRNRLPSSFLMRAEVDHADFCKKNKLIYEIGGKFFIIGD